MRIPANLMLLFAALAPLQLRAEMLDSLKTRDGREYQKVEVLANDDVGIRIRHDAGTARIPYVNLPQTLQSKYHYDEKKAKAKKAEELRIQQEHESSQQAEVPGNPAVSPAVPLVPKATASEVKPPSDDMELEKLEAYIVEMKSKVEITAAEAKKLRYQARLERSKTRSVVDSYDKKGRSRSKMVPDKSGSLRAKKFDEEAVALEGQVTRARVLIGTAEAKYVRLTGGATSPEPAARP